MKKAFWTWSLLVFSNLANAADFSVIEHELCNEIRLENKSESTSWSMQSLGGSQNVTDYNFKALQTNKLDRVHFGSENVITFKFLGKKIVPESLKIDQSFSLEVENLVDFDRDAVVGKFIGLTDLDPSTSRIPDASSPNGSRERILLAVLYANSDWENTPMTVLCSYVAGDVNPQDLNGKCVWIDSFSKASNGKPYCW